MCASGHTYGEELPPETFRTGSTNETVDNNRMARSEGETTMHTAAGGLCIVQLPILLALVSYYKDASFSMYTTTLVNATSREMEIEVETFSASVLYLSSSTLTALFAMSSRSTVLDPDTRYSPEALQEASMWDMTFWVSLLVQHTCILTYMSSPLDWYFLALSCAGVTLLLMLISRLPLVDGGRSRENILMLLCGMLYFTIYTTVRRHGHAGFFVGMLILDGLVLIGHTFDTEPNMQTVGNCRLCYSAGMATMLLLSYTSILE